MSDNDTSPTPSHEPDQMQRMLVNQAASLVIAYRRGELKPDEANVTAGQVLELAREVAAEAAAEVDASDSRPAQELAAFLRGVAAVLAGGEWPAVSGEYGDIVVQIEAAVAASVAEDNAGSSLADEVNVYDQAARAAFQAGDLARAIDSQQRAVALARQGAAPMGGAGTNRQALIRLSVMLYNLAGYYGQAGRPAEAVTTLEEVVALDERTAHPDLDKDREMLAAARQAAGQLAGGEPAEEPTAELSPEAQLLLTEMARQVEALPAEEQADLQRQMVRHNLISQAGSAIVALRRGKLDPEAAAKTADQVERSANQVAAGAEVGQRGRELATFLRAAAQVLRGWPWIGVPAGYQDIADQIEAAGGQAAGPTA